MHGQRLIERKGVSVSDSWNCGQIVASTSQTKLEEETKSTYPATSKLSKDESGRGAATCLCLGDGPGQDDRGGEGAGLQPDRHLRPLSSLHDRPLPVA